MDITVAEEQVFQLLPVLDIDQAREKAWDKKTAVFGTGLSAIFSRPKAEEIQITYSERRYEPFWHVACQVRYIYDRTRSYNVPVSASEVQRVTIEGVERQVTAKPRQFTIAGIEHCLEESSTELVFDAVSGQEQDWKSYLRFGKEVIPDLSKFAPEESIIVPPEVRASAVVRQVLGSMLRPIQADTVHEERVDVQTVDLYFRPLYAFEYRWGSKDKTAVAEFDGLTGEMSTGGVTLRQQVKSVLTPELLFDVGMDAVDLLVPGGGIAIKLAKAMVGRRSHGTSQDEQPG
jgi:hypothetical protein